MATLWLKNVTIVAPQQPELDGKRRDIRIEAGKIIEISTKIADKNMPDDTKIIENAHVSIGWIDVGTEICEPGFEHRENIESAAQAAMSGGFTTLVMQPTTAPAIHSKSEIHYIKNKTHTQLVDILTIGAISVDCKGKDLAEMMEMQHAGAIAFSDGSHSVQDAGLMLRALQYSCIFDGLIINFPHTKSIAAHGLVHESVVSTSLGLVGLPAMAEELMIQRDLHLLDYSEGRLHVSNISTAQSVALVRDAKARGKRVTASVAAMNLAYSDEVLYNFDTNFKVMPPLRGKTDIAALTEGLKDGTIDFIATNHVPQDEDAKNLEFPYADFGAIGLQTAFALTNLALQNVFSLSLLIEKWTIGARKVLKIPIPKIEVGSNANLTIFEPNADFVLEKKDIRSISKNSPHIGEKLRGRVLGVVNKNQMHFFD